jgi:hypothetical protein
MAWPTRGQQGPDFWDDDLKAYIDDADAASTADAAAAQADADAAQAAAAAAQADADAAQTTANNAIPKGDITIIDVLTQAEYDAIDPKVATTLYIIRPD